MHGTHEDAAKGYPEEGYGAVTGAEDSTEDRACAGYVEQLNKECTPTGHRHIINTVVEFCAWHFGFWVDVADLFEILAVSEVCGNEQDKTTEESGHNR